MLFSGLADALEPIDFIKHADYRDIQLSPDGKHIAVSMITSRGSTIIFFDRKSFKPVGRLGFSENTEPGDFYWVNNERIVLKLLEIEPWLEKPRDYGQLIGVNFDGKKAQTIYGYQNGESTLANGGSAKKRKKAIIGWSDFIDLLHSDPKNIIIQSTPQSKNYSSHPSILKLNVYTGKITTRLGTSPVERGGFLSDGKGNVKITYGYDKSDKLKAYHRQDNESSWKLIDDKFYLEGFTPISLIENSSEIYVGGYGQGDNWTLYRMNIISGEYSAPLVNDKFDITGGITSLEGKIIAVRLDDGYTKYKIINPEAKDSQQFAYFLTIFKDRKISITSRSNDGNYSVVRVSSDIEPAVFFLYTKKTNKFKRLFGSMPHLKASELNQMIPINFSSFDKRNISGYLTIPKDKKSKHPAIVLIHGGPHQVRDYWGYDSEVQLLVSQGFAVLQINYRGSEGYGYDFEKSGYRHWGDLIQQDIIAGTRWLATQSDIDNNNICIMGGSFGAYSAVLSATMAPSLYKCVVANAGIYDLSLMLDDGDIIKTVSGRKYLTKVLGTNIEKLKLFSPTNHVKKLQAPVLIAHGEKDRRAPFEHALRLREAMDKAGKPYEWFVKDKEGHGFYTVESRLEYYEKILSFLHENTRPTN